MTYASELKKMKWLLVIGIIADILLCIYTIKRSGLDSLITVDSLFPLLCVTLYPLGIAYGWRRILGYATEIVYDQPTDRFYTRSERETYFSGTLVAIILRWCLAIVFGWMFGIWVAIARLRFLKGQPTNSN